MTIPDRNVLPTKDGELVFPMFDNEVYERGYD